MSKIKAYLLFLGSVILNFIAGGIIWFFWQPIASWYWNYRPLLGIDFYNLTTYVAYLQRHFVFPWNGWRYTIWNGGPLSNDYPVLHAYLIQPLLSIFSLQQAVQFYVLASAFLCFFFAYLLFVELGKDRVLALILAIATAFSLGFYGALIWGGGLHSFATQLFVPLVIYLLVKFFHTQNKKWFYLSAFMLGVSILAHPLNSTNYIIPITFLLLLTYPFNNEKFFSMARFGRILVYFLLGLIIGYPVEGFYIGRNPLLIPGNFFNYTFGRIIALIPHSAVPEVGNSANVQVTKESLAVIQWQHDQLGRFFTDIHPIIYLLLAASVVIFLIALILHKKRKRSLRVLVFLLPAIWITGSTVAFAYGSNILAGDWYRAFWVVPIGFGIFISAVWGDFLLALKERFPFFKLFVVRVGFFVILGFFFAVFGYIQLNHFSSKDMLKRAETAGYRQQSSAFPDSLNVYVDKQGSKELSSRIVPSWLDPSDTQYRLYDADQRINIWWNALFDMPLARGYIDVHPGDVAGNYYLTSMAITQEPGGKDGLITTWKYPEEIAYNTALFMIDWFSIKYLEAEHEGTDSYNPLTSYFAKSPIIARKEKVIVPGSVQLYGAPDGSPIVWNPDGQEYLTYYQMKDNYVSPILHSTSASVVGVFSSPDGYNTIFRSLADLNINSKQLIPLNLGKNIDDVSLDELKNMDAVILYGYDYHNYNNAWDRITKYVEEGGKVFIDTGNDVKQSDFVNKSPGTDLPAIFPILSTKRAEVGTKWNFTDTSSHEVADIATSSFGPPVLDNAPWKFSLPAYGLRNGAKTILSDNNTSIIASLNYGNGTVVWSGMNLPYHISTYKNIEEAKMFKNILEDFIELKDTNYKNYTAKRLSPNKVEISGSNSKGVLFRENQNPEWPGWGAHISSKEQGKDLKIYKTGPTAYGFAYVFVPKDMQDNFKVTFSYRGEFWVYFWQIVWFVTVFLLLDYFIFGSKFLMPFFHKVKKRVHLKARKLLDKEREDDY